MKRRKKSVMGVSEFQPYSDFDGSRINAGRNYRAYKRENKLHKLIVQGKCPHNDVMVTYRCRCGCGLVKVILTKMMVK